MSLKKYDLTKEDKKAIMKLGICVALGLVVGYLLMALW